MKYQNNGFGLNNLLETATDGCFIVLIAFAAIMLLGALVAVLSN